MIGSGDSDVSEVGGHLYNDFPIGVSLAATPFVLAIDQVWSRLWSRDLDAYVRRPGARRVETFIASFFVALTAVFVYFIARRSLDGIRSLGLTFLFAFCTSAWSTASRSLWEHGPSMLMLAIALWLILAAKERPGLIQFAGLPLAFSYLVRPTNSIPVLLLTTYVWVEHRRYFLRYLVVASLVATPFVLSNLSLYHSLLPPYYLPQRLGPQKHFWEALAGNLVSPGRGLLVYTPVLLFAVGGVLLKVVRGQLGRLDRFLLAVIVLHWVCISCFWHWWAGHSFGPRFFTDMLPFFAYFLVPVLAWIGKLAPARSRAARAALGCLAAASFFIHFRGATSAEVLAWNREPWDIDLKPARLWDWQDIPFLRGLESLDPELHIAPLPGWYARFVPNKTEVSFGRTFELKGYKLGVDRASLQASVTLYWQASRPPDWDYAVFVHVIDDAGRMVAQKDQVPGASLGYPPTAWQPGDVIADKHAFTLPAPRGTYRLRVGVYRWQSGERMPAWSSAEPIGDSVLLDVTFHREAEGERMTPRGLLRDQVVRVCPASGGRLVSGDGDACLTFPEGAFADDVTLTWMRHWSAPQTGPLVDIGHTYELEAVLAESGQPAGLAPQRVYSLTVHYSEADLGPAIESTLALYHWDGSQWTADGSGALDTQANTLTAAPGRLSLWTVLGETRRTFFPRVMRER